MKRRTLLTAVAGLGVMVAGCVTSDSNEGTAENEDDTGNESEEDDTENEDTDDESSDEELSDSEIIDQFRENLEESGFEQVAVDPVDDGIELEYDATGTTESDVAAEIERITDAYTTAIEEGLSSTQLEATAYEPADGDALDYFTIETEWVEAYLSESLEWSELLTRIAETFVSNEPADEPENGDEGDAENGEDDEAENGEDDEAENESENSENDDEDSE